MTDEQELREMLVKWRRFKRYVFEALLFLCIVWGVVGFGLAIMGIRHG